MTHRILQPEGWAKPRGYANGISASGRVVFVAGQVGWNAAGAFESEDFVAQVAQALRNVVAVLAEDGAAPEHVARMTWYVTDRAEYVRRAKEIGAVYREIMGRNFPAMTAVEVSALVEDGAKVEIEVTAVCPPVPAHSGGRMHATLPYAIKFVADMNEAVAFHRDRLGLPVRFASPHWSEFETGSTTLALHLAGPDDAPGSYQLGFGVDDVDAFCESLAAAGVAVVEAPTDLHGHRLAKLRYPDGSLFSVSGPPRKPA